MTIKISIIVPIKEGELEWQKLLNQLSFSPKEIHEIILVGKNFTLPANFANKKFKSISSQSPGRAYNLNLGTKKANGEFLWFLHADSILDANTISNLLTTIKQNPNHCYYHNLDFYNSSFLMRLTELGIKLRLKLFNIPFGDQGICIKKEIFNQLGRFPEKAKHGEDHLFIWKAKQRNIPISSTKSKIYTSPRKYQTHGWIRTTAQHQYLWIKQAITTYIDQTCNKTALAIFAKTPELSPVKTRLAKDIGTKNAIKYYESFLSIIEQKATTIANQTNIIPYWAIAEKEALKMDRWRNLKTMHSGIGDLGERLHHVYNTLLKKHKYVIIIGTDSPQIPIDLIINAKNVVKKTNKIVIGPATDGGFYLFASNKKIPKQIWTNVTYSKDNTLDQLTDHLKNISKIKLLEAITDIDTKSDLETIRQIR